MSGIWRHFLLDLADHRHHTGVLFDISAAPCHRPLIGGGGEVGRYPLGNYALDEHFVGRERAEAERAALR
jgi:hypothetical protein